MFVRLSTQFWVRTKGGKNNNRLFQVFIKQILMLTDFIVGGLAGTGATIFTNPMDVIKTRLQLQGELCARADTTRQYRNILHAMYIIARTEGAPALQKGLMPAMLLGFSMNSVRLGMYHMAEVNGWTKKKDGNMSINRAAFWSAMGGYFSGLFTNPIMVVKTRIQAVSHPSIAVGRQHKYNGMTDAFITIYRQEGLKGYFAGINATSIRLSVGSATQLTTYSASKEAILQQGLFEESPFALAFYASLMSGVAVSVAICPFDVTTTRLYNMGPTSSGAQLYNGVWDAMCKIWRTEGFHGLYKGFGPLYWKIAPHTTLSLVIWDILNDIVSPFRKIL